MLSKLSVIAALNVALVCSPALAATTSGHHACANGNKKGCAHHYTGHHACKSGDKKGGCNTK